VKTALAVLAVLLCAAPALADEAPEVSASATAPDATPTFRRRYSPGFAIGALTDVRGYEGLDGAATAAGVGLGYAFDLVSVEAQVLQSFGVVGERKPTYLKANLDFALLTFGGFSVLGTVGLDYVFSGPDRQTSQTPGNLFGPELGLGARYRVMPLFDVVAYWTAGLWAAVSGPKRMYFEPGLCAGVQFHPFASE